MTMATMTFRAAKHRNVLYGLIGVSMIMSVFLVSQTHSRLRKAEDDAVKCQQKHDSVAAQFTVLYEHKARLEKSLQAEVERKKAVDDELKTMQSALSKEKMTQKEKYAKLAREYDEYKAQQTDEYSKLKSTYESLRSDKEKLDTEVDDLNIQNQKLKDSVQKLEEEITKMQQSQPIDINEVNRMRERLKVCDATKASGAVESPPDAQESAPKAVQGDGSDRNSPVAANEGEKHDDIAGVLPAPQQQVKGSSSTSKPVVQAPADQGDVRPDVGGLHEDAADPHQDDESQKRAFLGHHFGDNIDRKELPIFRQQQQQNKAGLQDRDYPDNLKDDDAGPDDGEEGAEKENNLNPDDNLNEDFDDTNNLNNGADVQRVKVLPK